MTDFSEEGFSATVVFSSDDVEEGSMTTYLTRGMVSTKQLHGRGGAFISKSPSRKSPRKREFE